MEFRLDSGQVELQQTMARFCADRFPLAAVVEREGAATGRASWDEMAALGMFGLLLPEDAGGSGLGVVDGALLFEQLGSHLAPGPARGQVVAALVRAPAERAVNVDDLRARLRQRLSAYTVPRRIVVAPDDAVPMMSSGKLDHRALKEMLGAA